MLAGSTHFMICRVRGLSNRAYLKDYGTLSVKVEVPGKLSFQTIARSGTADPEWNEVFAVVMARWEEITFSLVDRDWGMPEIIGVATLTMQTPCARDRLWVPLIDPKSSKPCCDLLVVMDSAPIQPPSPRSDDEVRPVRRRGSIHAQSLTVGVVLGDRLPPGNVYAALTIGDGNELTSSVGRVTSRPEWKENVVLTRDNGTMKILIMDQSAMSASDPLCFGMVAAEDLSRQGTWVPLQDKSGRPAGRVLLQAGGVRLRTLIDPDTGEPPALSNAETFNKERRHSMQDFIPAAAPIAPKDHISSTKKTSAKDPSVSLPDMPAVSKRLDDTYSTSSSSSPTSSLIGSARQHPNALQLDDIRILVLRTFPISSL